MARYLLIASRDPYESHAAADFHRLAVQLAQARHEVTVFLVQNGVLPARGGAVAPGLDALRTAGVTVLADDFSLRERGITSERLAPGVQAASLDAVIDRLADGHTTLWQ